MEHQKTVMIKEMQFSNNTSDSENEKASNSYLMSLVALIAGMPLPIINLLATLFFYLGNRKAPYFVRWHCTQALLSQFALLGINSVSFWWTVSIVFGDEEASNQYFAYLFSVIIFNLIEIFTTIYAAIQTRKGKHIQFYFFGNLTNLICKS